MSSKLSQIVISVFVVFHAGAIFFWAMPPVVPILQEINSFTRPYMIFSGLSQKWNLFAPTTYTENIYVNADIRFDDGKMEVWEPQRPNTLGYVDRYLQAHYRKFLDERLAYNAHIWPDAARYIARLYRNRPSPPAIVRLIQHSFTIPPPFQRWTTESVAPNSKVLFVYSVTPNDLK